MDEPRAEKGTTEDGTLKVTDRWSGLEFARLIVEYHSARVALIDFLRQSSHGRDGNLRETLHSLGLDPAERF